MSHGPEYSKQDLDSTRPIIGRFLANRKAGRSLELCAGSCRCWDLYKKFSKVADIHDLHPAWGQIPISR